MNKSTFKYKKSRTDHSNRKTFINEFYFCIKICLYCFKSLIKAFFIYITKDYLLFVFADSKLVLFH